MQTALRTLVWSLALIGAVNSSVAGEPFLYAGDSFTGTLYSIDKATGATINSVTVTLDGTSVNSIKGLAAQESTGVLYAVVRADIPVDGVLQFVLVTIAPDTGVATEIGVLDDRFAGLAWVALPPTDGQPPWVETLVGVTGDGATNPEQLFVIDPTTAATTLYMNLGNGDDGEAIAYNPDDNLLYHLSGWNSGGPVDGGGSDLVFEKIDLLTMSVTDIPLSGATFTNGNGLVYDAATAQFVFSAGVDPPVGGDGFGATELFALTTAGVASSLGTTDAYLGGMAFSELVPVELVSFTVE